MSDATDAKQQQAVDWLRVREDEATRRRREHGIRYYIPNPLQHRAHQSKARTVIFSGGNRCGKSTMGAAELTWHLTREYPDWFPKERRFRRPIKAVVVVTSFPIIERAIEPKIRELLPRGYVKHEKRTPQGYLSRITCIDGSTVDVLTNEMDTMAFESAAWDFYWGDEPQKKAKYYAVRRGLVDRRGLSVLTFTPLTEPWMKEELLDKEDGIRIEVFKVSLWDNQFDIAGGTIQSAEDIKEFEMMLPEDLRRTRIYGEFFHLRGIVYPEYSPAIHERIFAYEYPDPVICILDPHTRKPHHVLWAYLTRHDMLCIDQELLFKGTIQDLSKQILLTEARAGYRMKRRLIDPNFGRSPQMIGGRSVMDELGRPPFSVRFGEANDNKEAGILKVKDYLHFRRDQPISITNCPQLFFHRDRCTVTIRQMKNYQHADWTGKLADERDPKEQIKQKDTDGPDCIRYLCMSNPHYDQLKAQASLQPMEVFY